MKKKIIIEWNKLGVVTVSGDKSWAIAGKCPNNQPHGVWFQESYDKPNWYPNLLGFNKEFNKMVIVTYCNTERHHSFVIQSKDKMSVWVS